MAQALRTLKEIGVDLEFDRNSYTYGFNLCLLQVSGNNINYIVDPLSTKMLSLNPLFEIFEDSFIQKIFHSPSEDLRLLHSLNCYPRNIFDTEVAAKLLNTQYTGLATLISTNLGLSIEKSDKISRSNWMKRPLSDSQIAYAAADVIHLSELKRVLVEKCSEKGLLHILEEENIRWETFREKSDDRDNFLSSKDKKFLSPFQAHVFNGMLKLVDKYAQKFNKPAGYIIRKQDLIEYMFPQLREYSVTEMPPSQATELVDNQYVFRPLPFAGLKNVHWVMQKPETIAAFKQQYEMVFKEAIALQLHLPNATMSKTKQKLHLCLRALDEIMTETLVPNYGEYAAHFLLSRTLVAKVIEGAVNMSEVPAFRRGLLTEVFNKAGVSF